MKSITILGAGESGFGAAMLAHHMGFNVFVSDLNKINDCLLYTSDAADE